MNPCSFSLVSRRTFPGTPATSEPGGTVTPCEITAPAATTEPRPTVAPFMITPPIPTRQPSSTGPPCTTARCPTVTFSPTVHGKPGSACSTEPSWMFEPAPTATASASARTTAPYQTPTSAPRVTRPATTAPGAIQAVGSTCGVWPSTVT